MLTSKAQDIGKTLGEKIYLPSFKNVKSSPGVATNPPQGWKPKGWTPSLPDNAQKVLTYYLNFN